VSTDRSGEPLRFLLVEDDPLYATLVRRAFERAGVTEQMETAGDGADALALLRNDPNHRRVVLLDINMPGLSGHEVLEAVRTDSVLHATPVVMLTSSRHAGDIKRAYGAGANAYMVKPRDLSGLCELASVLQRFWAAVEHPLT
jgi:chemotaxis family two-component system response regulator Rcp1